MWRSIELSIKNDLHESRWLKQSKIVFFCRLHILSVHTPDNLKPYQCQICVPSRGFATKWNLVIDLFKNSYISITNYNISLTACYLQICVIGVKVMAVKSYASWKNQIPQTQTKINPLNFLSSVICERARLLGGIWKARAREKSEIKFSVIVN